jgi:hypothetical protein
MKREECLRKRSSLVWYTLPEFARKSWVKPHRIWHLQHLEWVQIRRGHLSNTGQKRYNLSQLSRSHASYGNGFTNRVHFPLPYPPPHPIPAPPTAKLQIVFASLYDLPTWNCRRRFPDQPTKWRTVCFICSRLLNFRARTASVSQGMWLQRKSAPKVGY